jgi:hypothetical protein
MQTRIRFLLYSEAYDGWLNRMAEKHTQDIYAALWFSTADQAKHWLLTYDKAPKDIENYEIQETLTTMEVIEDDRSKEPVSEDQPSHAGR